MTKLGSDPNLQTTSESTKEKFVDSNKFVGLDRFKSGQVMLSTVLILSGTILGATTIAGLLMLYQIRQSTNIGDSAKAIFAADSGLECQFWNKYKDPDADCATLGATGMTNGASFITSLPDASTVRSIGSAGEVIRAFEAIFE